mmetsp:Transcript_57688/g.158966  ORF Transcript_57688/g.158966 Transcript_57688/m.158966 type:complete len:176 (+) Transcript_57688:170-697(+)
MSFGVPHNAIAIRPRIASTIDDALYDRERDARVDPPPPTDPFYRCAVCTLMGGTCEHTPAWINKKAQDLLTTEERSAGINRDSVDAQLSDLVDVIGFADPAKNRRPPKTALSRSLGNDGEVHNPEKIHKKWAAKQAELEFNGLDVKEDRGVARMEKLKKETAMLARKVKLIPESC